MKSQAKRFTFINRIIMFLFLLSTALLLLYWSLIQFDIEHLAQSCCVPLFVLIPSAAYRIFRLKPMPKLTTLIYIFSYLAYTIGVAGSGYRLLAWYDKFVHVLSGIFFALIGMGAYYFLKSDKRIEKEKDFKLAAVFSFSFSMMIGAMWEVWEYFADQCLGMNVQHVPETGIHDTMQDIIACLIGAVIFVILMYLYYKKKKNIFPCTVVEEFIETCL